MKALVTYSIGLMIGTISLTNFVFATGETAPTATVECPACSSGSPEMKAYITWMSEILTIIGGVKDEDPGVIPGQQINITRKNQETSAWATYISNNGVQSISQQARGVKSDLVGLNKLHDSIALAGIKLINKAQRTTIVDPTILTNIRSKVGTSKILMGAGNWSNTMTYKDLVSSLIQLHTQVSSLTLGQSGSVVQRQGYTSNTGSIVKLTTYYSCAQTIPRCSNQSAALDDMSASVRGYWGDILRAGQQIGEVFTAQYRDTGSWSKKIAFGDGFGQAGDDIKEIAGSIGGAAGGVWSATKFTGKKLWETRPGGGNWKEFAQNIRTKRAARKAQRQSQKETTEALAKTQEAIKKGGTVDVAPTQTQVQGVVGQASYNTQDISYLAQMLNTANDELLNERIEAEKHTIISDSRLITYKIPELTKQIYDTQVSVKQAADKIYNQCLKHCTEEVKEKGKGICGATAI